MIPQMQIIWLKCQSTCPRLSSISPFLRHPGSFFITLMPSGHSPSTRRCSSPVVLNCLGLFSHPNCHSRWSHQRKGFALCPSSMKWKGGRKAKRVSPKPLPIVLFHQPQRLARPPTPSQSTLSLTHTQAPPLGLINGELRSQLKMEMNNLPYTSCLQ